MLAKLSPLALSPVNAACGTFTASSHGEAARAAIRQEDNASERACRGEAAGASKKTNSSVETEQRTRTPAPGMLDYIKQPFPPTLSHHPHRGSSTTHRRNKGKP